MINYGNNNNNNNNNNNPYLFYVTLLTVRNYSKLSFRDTVTNSVTRHNETKVQCST